MVSFANFMGFAREGIGAGGERKEKRGVDMMFVAIRGRLRVVYDEERWDGRTESGC